MMIIIIIVYPFFLAGFVAKWAGSFVNSYQRKFAAQRDVNQIDTGGVD
jgi:hypothetical protein